MLLSHSGMTMREALGVLKLAMPFTEAQLKKAYRKASMQVHPDLCNLHAQDLVPLNYDMADVNSAYSLLKTWLSEQASGVKVKRIIHGTNVMSIVYK